MFDLPDSLATWLGLSLAATAFLAAALAVPAVPPPDATAVAATVDRTATSDYDTAAVHRLTADAVRVTSRTVSLRSAGGTTTAAFVARVTPVEPDTALASVLRGNDPDRVFDTPLAFERAALVAQRQVVDWQPRETVRVRHVLWRGVDVVLVG